MKIRMAYNLFDGENYKNLISRILESISVFYQTFFYFDNKSGSELLTLLEGLIDNLIEFKTDLSLNLDKINY